jgi:hypothetical protein
VGKGMFTPIERTVHGKKSPPTTNEQDPQSPDVTALGTCTFRQNARSDRLRKINSWFLTNAGKQITICVKTLDSSLVVYLASSEIRGAYIGWDGLDQQIQDNSTNPSTRRLIRLRPPCSSALIFNHGTRQDCSDEIPKKPDAK